MSEFQLPEGAIAINSTEQLTQLVIDWQENVMAQLSHIANLPSDLGIEVSDDDSGEVIHITDQRMEDFVKGILVAKTLIGTLPFKMQEVDIQSDSEI